jgi:hypothetical protein
MNAMNAIKTKRKSAIISKYDPKEDETSNFLAK